MFLAILLLPLSIWAMTPLTDSELSDVSGQAGVSFMFDIAMHIHFDVLAWGDSDGLGTKNIWGTDTNLTITNLYIGPRMDASIYDELYPTTIDGTKIISHTVDYSNMQTDLSTFQNPLIPWNSRWH